ncbi:MAG TPA: DUF2169 domain-containing protein [Steroidobacteraceae bacterium]
MRIVKPASLGLLPKPYRFRQQSHLAIGALGFFQLGAVAQSFLLEQFQWPLALAALPPNEPLDFAMPKARGEMLLAACAHPPGGNPVAQMSVRAMLGPIDKSLLVMGEREWLFGTVPLYTLTEARPFTEMPITYARAFGGQRCAPNPLGRGYLGKRPAALFGTNRGPAWNIEDPRDPVRSPHHQQMPAGFGPLDIRSPARRRKAGTYGRRWLKRDFPGLAEDLDWSLFNAAPLDQQIQGFFTGGEPYRLEGLHPRDAVIEGHLPRLRVRSFVHRKGTEAGDMEEIPMVCDTVWFFPSQRLGVQIYRGRTTIQDSDALDVESVMLAYEVLDHEPRPLDHFRRVLQGRIDPDTAALQGLNDAPLIPLPSELELARRARKRAQAEAEDRTKRQALLDESMADFWKKSGIQQPPDYVPPKAEPALLPQITFESVANGEIDLVDIAKRAQALADEARQKGEARLAEAAAQTPASAQQPAQCTAETAAVQLTDAVARASEVAYDLLPDGVVPLPPQFKQPVFGARDEAQTSKLQSAVAPLPSLQRQVRRLSPKPLFPKQPLLPEVAARLGDVVSQWQARGECLAGRDLAGVSLKGAKFESADLRETLFEKADLSSADFRGAQLQGAVFTAACLDDADFTGANLTGAMLGLAQARRACFRGARLESATLTEACCDGADFSDAALVGVVAVKARLAGAEAVGSDMSRAVLVEAQAAEANFSKATFVRSVLLGSNLSRANFTGATLERTVLLNVAATGSVWRNSRLTSVQAGGTASFAQADCTEMSARQCGWRGSDLRGANLAHSRLIGCDFGGCHLEGANLKGALLWRSLFMQASLRDCHLEETDFFQALCRKADLRGSSLHAARLTQADLSETVLDHPPRKGETA